MADEDTSPAPDQDPAATPDKSKKKAVGKKAAKKKVAKKVAARSSDARAGGAAAAATPAEPPSPSGPVAQAASVDPGAYDGGGGGEESGMSGWLVMWGPLIIIGFLILVFMDNEREPVAQRSEPAEVVTGETGTPALEPPAVPPVEPGIELSPERAASDLTEAFKAAGIPLPADATTSRAPAPAQPDLPPELQANPWAPAPGQYRAPMPGYGYPVYPVWPYGGGGYPPPAYGGYGYGGPPPGYAYPPMGRPGQMGAPGMGYRHPMMQGMPPQPGMGRGMGPGMGPGTGMGQGAAPAAESDAPPPPGAN